MHSDFLIIGAGIVGLTIAHELRKKYPSSQIAILEKESDVAYHSSGRNSGVLHSGVYYSQDSLKAKFVVQGNKLMRAFCQDKGISINETKKLILCSHESELPELFKLVEKSKLNGVEHELITSKEVAAIEPLAKTVEHALFSPTTANIDPLKVCLALKEDLISKGITFYFETAFLSAKENVITTKDGRQFTSSMVINCAGLYADKIAHNYGIGKHLYIIPFKGIYLKIKDDDFKLRTNLYPVPNPAWPFLGVHFTVDAYNNVKIGPTAIPAFWRENYSGFKQFKLDEAIRILGLEAKLFLKNSFNFRDLAIEEMKKFNRSFFLNEAFKLVNKKPMNPKYEWLRPGIRAQLIDLRTNELVNDFLVERGPNSIHVLNAVSPAFTCGFAFAEWIVEQFVESSTKKL